MSRSDLILTARLAPDAAAIIGAAPDSSYVSIPLEARAVLKGAAPEALALRHYVERKARPLDSATLAASGRSALFFLTVVGGAHYLASDLQIAVRGTEGATLKAVRTELARQDAILGAWPVDRSLPHFAAVQRLIRRLGSGTLRQQQASFTALEKLGAAAVSAIVAQMDDRRTLVGPRISLANHAPDAFEAVRHYGPEQVVDALAAVLNQSAGAGFGFIYNGGSESQRRAVVNGWRAYAADLRCARDAAS